MEDQLIKAWMAGFVDGEGCITIAKQVRKNRPTPSWRPFITITNTHKGSLEIFKERYGGVLRFNKEKRRSKTGVKWSDSWTWYCPQGMVMVFCYDLRPYIKIKNEQVEIMLDFMHHMQTTKRQKGGRNKNGSFKGSGPLSPDAMKYRDEMRDKIQSLNSGKRFK